MYIIVLGNPEIVECDHTFFGKGKRSKYGRGFKEAKHNIKTLTGISRKTNVMVARTVPNLRQPTTHGVVKELVLSNTKVMSDQDPNFASLTELSGSGYNYTHGHCNHSGMMGEDGSRSNFVNPDDRSVHINTAEGMHGRLKQSVSVRGVTNRSPKLAEEHRNLFFFYYNQTNRTPGSFFFCLSLCMVILYRPDEKRMPHFFEPVDFEDVWAVDYIIKDDGAFLFHLLKLFFFDTFVCYRFG